MGHVPMHSSLQFAGSCVWMFMFAGQIKYLTSTHLPLCVCVVAVSKQCNHFSNLRWAKMAKPCWTNCSDLWPQAVLILWLPLQTTLKRCTTSWTSSTRFFTTRDSWKTSGSTAKCGCTNVCSSASFNRTSSRYTHTHTHIYIYTTYTVYMFLFICIQMFFYTWYFQDQTDARVFQYNMRGLDSNLKIAGYRNG